MQHFATLLAPEINTIFFFFAFFSNIVGHQLRFNSKEFIMLLKFHDLQHRTLHGRWCVAVNLARESGSERFNKKNVNFLCLNH